jgi:hypothetical protein
MMMFLAAVGAAAAAAAASCSGSGTLRGARCVCDPPFGGPDCVGLAQGLPTAPRGVFAPAGVLERGGALQATWGGSPFRDAATGRYHLFFSWFEMPDNSTVPSIKWWYNTSRVAHAVSEQPDRGYEFQSVVLPPRGRVFFDGSTTHCPTVMQLPDLSYALFYIGLNCFNYTGTDADTHQSECIKHQWIGAAHATSLDGPWERLPEPVLSGRGRHDIAGKPVGSWEGGMVANPAVVALRNGTLLMAYRGLEDRGMGMATSAAWNQPFRRLNGGAAVEGPAYPAHTAVDEDPTMWISPGGTVQMILHQEGVGAACGAHAYSLDAGLSWVVAGTAYNVSVGGTVAFVRRERPQMLKGADGQPTHLFSGVVDRGTGYMHTIAVPLKTTDHLAQQQPITCQPPELQIPIFHIIGNITRTGAGALVRENINDANGVFKWRGVYHIFHQCCQNHWITSSAGTSCGGKDCRHQCTQTMTRSTGTTLTAPSTAAPRYCPERAR